MNKKFSTLLAGAALLGAVTANAGGHKHKPFDNPYARNYNYYDNLIQ